MNKNLQKFGENLKELRIKKGLTLRKVCDLVGYDYSNWSKIERGRMAPPADEKMLGKWVRVLGIKNKEEITNFVHRAKIAQGIIPSDILSSPKAVESLPAFFRTLQNKKPSKEDIDKLIELIRSA
jgi:transcriptional regulator with XRE-family HTH domain